MSIHFPEHPLPKRSQSMVISLCVCVRARACVCVHVRERERERKQVLRQYKTTTKMMLSYILELYTFRHHTRGRKFPK
jgi:hypothetical protein